MRDTIDAYRGKRTRRSIVRLHTGQANLGATKCRCLGELRLGKRKRKLASVHHDLAAAWSWGCPKLWQLVSACSSPRDGDRIRRDSDYQGKDFQPQESESELAIQRSHLDLIQSINSRHLRQVGVDRRIEGLIDNYELAFKMQSTIPSVIDLSQETKETLDLYGIDSEPTDNFGRQCLLARKFAENGVRYIQVSTNYTWDHHKQVKEGSIAEAAKVDRPIAGLLADLQRRGLLDDTLVVWGAEFGRTPTVENGDGRNHHPKAFTMWMAGGGCKPGLTYGATDEFGYAPIENPVHMHDLHATLLYLLGLDHERLTYRHAGRDFRLTDVYGNVVHDILA